MSTPLLVVEDDIGLQETIQAMLEFEGYDVVVARDGIEGLTALDKTLPSLILLDLMMPRMNGYDFVEELQRRGLRSSIPILILTADGRAEQKAAALGVEGYLAKPFDMNSLLDSVARLLPS